MCHREVSSGGIIGRCHREVSSGGILGMCHREVSSRRAWRAEERTSVRTGPCTMPGSAVNTTLSNSFTTAEARVQQCALVSRGRVLRGVRWSEAVRYFCRA